MAEETRTVTFTQHAESWAEQEAEAARFGMTWEEWVRRRCEAQMTFRRECVRRGYHEHPKGDDA
jgi:hypothetical protein